ncbi:Cx9C motif-containing protein 4, mitochondrial [Rhodotorula toruloides]|nr:Cx9C motif-containing protein 4, mitochondrial [Rhodotorula toruloides]
MPPEACQIQTDDFPFSSARNCMISNAYQQEKCGSAIRNLYECCAQFYDKKGDKAEPPDACPLPEILQRKLKDLGMRQAQGK